MISTAAPVILAFLVATAYGAGFHVIMGGPPRKVGLYIMSGWIGFALGHVVGDMIDLELLRIGVVHLFAASIGSWIALVASWVLSGR